MSRWLLLSMVLTLVALAAALYLFYVQPELLPAQVPVHWGVSGKPDHFVPRQQVLPYLLIMPGVMAGFVVLTLVLPWLSPRQFTVDTFRSTYDYIMGLFVIMMGYLQGVILLASTGWQADIGKVMLGALCLFFVLLGNVLGKVQRNFWMGVRTPWTLASETVWIRTHRVAAYLFVGAGLLGIVAMLAGLHFLVVIPLILLAAFAPVIYSLVLYKRLEKQGRLEAPSSSPQPETRS
jgi:uncharacterized membrane protein